MAKRKVTEEVIEAVDEVLVKEVEPIVMTVKCEILNIRAEASIDSEVLGTLTRGTNVLVEISDNGWSKLVDRSGYVMSKFIG